MGLRTKADPKLTALAAEIEELTAQIGQLKGEVRGLRDEKQAVTERDRLRREITDLEIAQSKLTEDNARKVREAEHKAGLLMTKQDQDVANARREAVLEVKEANLSADRARFESEMKFQREQMQRNADDVKAVLAQVLERLPSIDVSLAGQAAPSRRSRKAVPDGE